MSVGRVSNLCLVFKAFVALVLCRCFRVYIEYQCSPRSCVRVSSRCFIYVFVWSSSPCLYMARCNLGVLKNPITHSWACPPVLYTNVTHGVNPYHRYTWLSIKPDLAAKQFILTCLKNSWTPSRLLEKHSSWSWLRECQECAKLSSRQWVATLKNLKYKIFFDLCNTFLVTTWFHMCYFIVLMSSPLFCNVENSKNKERPLNE